MTTHIVQPLPGEFVWHVVDLYCEKCERVTRHEMKFSKIDPDDGNVLANCLCKREYTKTHKSSNWKKTTKEQVVCGHYQCLSVHKNQWLRLISGTSSGGSHESHC